MPTAYKSVHGIVKRKFADDTKFSWHGDTVNGKTESKSYKIKKRAGLPTDRWQIVPNTHKAIIDRETWELVQKSRRNSLNTTVVRVIENANAARDITSERTLWSGFC